MGTAPRALFEQTCLPLLPDCYAFALSLTRKRHDAEDLVQDTFLRAQRAFASFTPGTNAKAWLFTILRRLHIDRYRRARIRPTALPDAELVEMAGSIETAKPALPAPEL
ncbi:MAG: sigma-70 family RNA polymerase sigma factor, partial [Candidatus Krumholzibacteriia bacterium]